MAYNYVWIDGHRVEVAVAYAFRRLKAAFEQAFPGLTLRVRSGVRTRAEQERLYYGWIHRLPGFNLAAPPGKSNHEESGPIGPRAIDIYDTGGDAGVTTMNTRRDRWMAANAPNYGFSNAGYNFWPREAWHKEFTGKLGVVPAGHVGPTPYPVSLKEDDMPIQIRNVQTKMIAMVAPKFFAHVRDIQTAEVTKNVFSVVDEQHQLSNDDFFRVTRTMGIPDAEVRENNLWYGAPTQPVAVASPPLIVKKV
ncbi:endolysin [Microbacterium phage AnnaLie]|uniref:endolysin n=1 Tax=Microbacterium phage AnnaLie TaxID=2772023 RepID=UPI0012A97BBC|nr:hypothetical protein QDW46_gp22 [Microbacterium phage SansAfet]YP_010754072.1 endolysin [Microbacterium phage AnnaLie]QFP94278.1 hypothetical protein SEA_SANSAFET_22 [Microbacterium phage SansAfet]QOC59472.1 endolysin [Microbacterium phage AnnaLie]QUE25501.1 endolysin [Microbacterium phage BelmontSKP]